MPSYQEVLAQVAKNQAMPLVDRERAQLGRLTGEADIYRQALEKSEYGQLGRDLSSGLGAITNRFAGLGPLADSGAATAVRAKLASQLYGAAQGRTQAGYADYLRRIMDSQRQFRQNQILQKQAQKAQKQGVLGTLGGIAGGALSMIPGIGPVASAALGAGRVPSAYETANYGGGSFASGY